MKLLCQLISRADGFRSEPFTCEKSAVPEIIGKLSVVPEEHYFLVLAEMQDDQMRVSQCPLVTINQMIEFIGGQNV